MKKTLIAFMALSGLAMAATTAEMNATMAAALTETGYNSAVGDTFTLSFTLDNAPGGTYKEAAILTLMPGLDIRAERNNNALVWGHIGISNGNTIGRIDNAATKAKIFAPSEYDFNTRTATWNISAADVESGISGAWVNRAMTMSEGSFTVGDIYPLEVTSTLVTVECNGSSSTITLTPSKTPGNAIPVKYVITLTDIALDAKAISFGEGAASYSNFNLVATPEPATATLSLLALAGLAARRKRH